LGVFAYPREGPRGISGASGPCTGSVLLFADSTSMKGSRQSSRPVPTTSRGLPRALPWLGAGVVIAVVILVAAFVMSSRLGSSSSQSGAALGATAPSNGQPATTGQTLSLTQLRGSKVVVYFYEESG
jgi:hypothetical protein